MAELDDSPLIIEASPHDGAARCRLCTCTEADAQHEWCEAVDALVCEDCCQRVLLGDIGHMMAVAAGAIEASERPSSCADCERGQRWVAGHVLGAMADRGRSH